MTTRIVTLRIGEREPCYGCSTPVVYIHTECAKSHERVGTKVMCDTCFDAMVLKAWREFKPAPQVAGRAP